MTPEQRQERDYRWVRRFVVAALVWVAVALGVLGWVAEARAEPFTPELNADYAEALAYWGVGSPPLCTSVTLELVGPDDLGGAWGLTTRPTRPSPCRLRVIQVEPCLERAVMIHEVSHLVGYADQSSDPSSFTYFQTRRVFCEGEREVLEEQRELQAAFRTFKRILRHEQHRCHHRKVCRWAVRQAQRNVREVEGETL